MADFPTETPQPTDERRSVAEETDAEGGLKSGGGEQEEGSYQETLRSISLAECECERVSERRRNCLLSEDNIITVPSPTHTHRASAGEREGGGAYQMCVCRKLVEGN